MLRPTFFSELFCFFLLIAACQGEEAKNGTSLSVTPSRVELGSLEFGSVDTGLLDTQLVVSGMPSQIKITHIDCSHARGVQVVGQYNDENKTVVVLKLNKQQLCESEPFGAFIRREVRLETNSSLHPQFVVPIVGWLDVNNSSRDFNQFVFKGAPRWQGIWPTPNVAGSLLASAVLFLTGVITWLWKRSKEDRFWIPRAGLVLSILAIVTALIFLELTYSRGAWVALLAGLAFLVISRSPLRKLAQLLFVTFFGFLLILPFGLQRMESCAVVFDDLSIANRLKLWEGALQIMAEHPWAGVGSGRFAPVFQQDFQKFDHTAKTSTAVNDYLTFGSERGIISLSLALGSLLSVLALGVRLSVETKGIAITTITAVLTSATVASNFSTLWIVPEYFWLFVTTVLILGMYAVVAGICKLGYVRFGTSLILRTSLWTVATLATLGTLSAASLADLPTRTFTLLVPLQDHALVSYRAVDPRWKQPCGIILYLADCKNSEVLYQSTLRPLAAMGWRVVPISDSSDPAMVCDLIRALRKQSPELSLFVAGDLNGGRVAWKIAGQLSSTLVMAGAGFDFLSMDLDAPSAVNRPQQPFLVYQSLYSEGISSNPAICAQNKVAFKDLPLTVVLSEDGINHSSAGWIRFLKTVSEFFLNESRHGY